MALLSRRSFSIAAASLALAGHSSRAQANEKVTIGLGIPLTVTDGSIYASFPRRWDHFDGYEAVDTLRDHQALIGAYNVPSDDGVR